MEAEKLYEIADMHHWLDYQPHEGHYGNYSPGQVVAAFKISDVYHTFCFARSSLCFLELDNYGQMIEKHDQLHVTWAKAHFFLNALACYNYCVDLSWQAAWLYYAVDEYQVIEDEEQYNSLLEECYFDELWWQLTLLKQFKLRNHLQAFKSNRTFHLVREKYNYQKHRGTFHFVGMGQNPKKFMGSVNGFKPKLLAREEINIDEWKEILIEFDLLFVRYFDQLINMLLPKDFANMPFDFTSVLKVYRKLKGHK
ncbi:hypothetical protein P9302_24670 [Brevibacillus agri]|uniref:Uncharacterized protein n=1 Tax=Brevibacillus thermoruber TaxID=33942 RepID=A0A9X3Z5V8_9BACL|nr:MULTISPECIES: hypothetical protein [Brevibacillus]MCG5251606.1 hypothetical protein [Brevibacillus agri]MDA5111095.1 hypothetical protein [Brevibacillus thermoruber]MED4572637.1 hypothetical protein [Brevibacillus agri]